MSRRRPTTQEQHDVRTRNRCRFMLPDSLKIGNIPQVPLRCVKKSGHEGMCKVTFSGGLSVSWNQQVVV